MRLHPLLEESEGTRLDVRTLESAHVTLRSYPLIESLPLYRKIRTQH